MKTNPNSTATPISFTDDELKDVYGLTKREYFSALAMQGMLANVSGAMTEGSARSFHPDDIARLALNQADALIKALNKEEQQ